MMPAITIDCFCSFVRVFVISEGKKEGVDLELNFLEEVPKKVLTHEIHSFLEHKLRRYFGLHSIPFLVRPPTRKQKQLALDIIRWIHL